MGRGKGCLFVLFILLLFPLAYAISNVNHSVNGNKVTLTYQGTAPFYINIRKDITIGEPGGYLWAKTNSTSFTYDMGFAVNPSNNFYYSVKDSSWNSYNSFSRGESYVTCANDTGCYAVGSFCDGNMPYTCSLGSDGCLDKINGNDCSLEGKACKNGECTEITPTNFDGWRVLPIRSQQEFEQGKIGGEAEQHLHGIARCLQHPEIIYWSHDCGQVWKSTNSGESWKKTLGKNLSLIAGQSIEVDPVNSEIVFEIVDEAYNWLINDKYNGVYKSEDGGDNWKQVLSIKAGYPSMYQHSIAYDPTSITEHGATRWYAAYATTAGNGIFRSEDQGNTWTGSLGAISEVNTTYDLKCHPFDGQTVYEATNKGLYCSNNKGENIAKCGNLPEGEVSSIDINPKNPDIIYATIKNTGLYKSTTGINGFSLLKSFDAFRVFMNPGFPDTIYLVGMTSNTIISHDGGNSWITNMKTVPALGLGRSGSSWKGKISGRATGIVPNPQDENEAVAFSRATIWKTSDGGKYFNDSSTLFTGFAASWAGDGYLFGISEPEKLMTLNCDVAAAITNNAGDYFDMRSSGIWNWYNQGLIGWIGTYSGDIHPTKPNVIVASVGDYFKTQLMRTEDEGKTWNLVTTGADNIHSNFVVTFNPTENNIVFAGNKVSYDEGKTFTKINFTKTDYSGNFSSYDPYFIGMCNSNPDTVYAISNNDYHILRSDNRGETWYEYSPQGGFKYRRLDPIPTFAVDPINCNRVYALVNYDLAIYNGTNWRKTGVLELAKAPSDMKNFVRRVVIDPKNNSIIYASMFASGISTIWRSKDGGYTWEDISYNLPRIAGVNGINQHTGEVFAGGCIGTWIFPAPYESNNTFYKKAISMPSCHDGLKNGDETAVDAGGSCEVIKGCVEQRGDICLDTEYCSGNNLTALDTSRCCNIPCVVPSWANCSECGKGLFNLCDGDECHSIFEGCYYDGAFNCLSCSRVSCSSYNNEVDCATDKCGKSCSWDGSSCVKKVS